MKYQREEVEYELFPTIKPMPDEDMNPNIDLNLNPNIDLNQHKEFEETSGIFKQLMSILPYFLSKKFKLWSLKIEVLNVSVDLQQFIQETFINPHDKSRGVIPSFLIISALDENILFSILHEFGEACNAKLFWDILEMK